MRINLVVGHQRTKRSEFANVASDLISVITLDNASKACVRVMLLAGISELANDTTSCCGQCTSILNGRAPTHPLSNAIVSFMYDVNHKKIFFNCLTLNIALGTKNSQSSIKVEFF